MLRDMQLQEQPIDGDFRMAQIEEADVMDCKTLLHNIVSGPCVECPRWFRPLAGGRGSAMISWNTRRRGRKDWDDVYDAVVETRFVSLQSHLSWRWSDTCFNYKNLCAYRNKYIGDHDSMLYATKSGGFQDLIGWREWLERPYRPNPHRIYEGTRMRR